MIFNGIDLSPYLKIIDIQGRGFIENNLSLINAPHMDITHLSNVQKKPKPIKIKAQVIVQNRSELRERIDFINDILDVNEEVPIIFPDEPNLTYYGIPEASTQSDERFFLFNGSITIRRTKPYKYGSEKTELFNGDTVTINNEGSTEAEPIIELDVLEPITFAMVSNGEEYNMIGKPADDDVEVVDTKQLVYETSGEDLSDWNSRPREEESEFVDPVVGGVTDGTFTFDGTGIIVDDYGEPFEGRSGYGPAIWRELPQPVQNFELEAILDTRTDFLEENFRMEIYLFDEGINNIGKMGIRDRFKDFHNRSGLARVGAYVDDVTRYFIGKANYDYNNLGKSSMFFFRWKREGDLFTFYIAEVVNGKHVNTITRTYHDRTGEWTGRVRYIQLFVRSWKNRNRPYLARFNSIRVWELTETEIDQTPYIAYPGDKILFDHVSDEILLNGEDTMSEKDFGGQFFDLKKGENVLALLPAQSLSGNVRYRPRIR